jgi:hypothetical protein
VSKVGTVLKDIVKGIEYPFKFAAKAEKVMATVIKDDPQARVILTTLVQKCEAIGADGLQDVAAKGLNLAEDQVTIAALVDLGAYLKSTVLPFVETAYGTIVEDVKATTTTTTTTTTTA